MTDSYVSSVNGDSLTANGTNKLNSSSPSLPQQGSDAPTSSIIKVPDQPPATVSATTTAPEHPAPDTTQQLALLVDMVSMFTKHVGQVEQS